MDHLREPKGLLPLLGESMRGTSQADGGYLSIVAFLQQSDVVPALLKDGRKIVELATDFVRSAGTTLAGRPLFFATEAERAKPPPLRLIETACSRSKDRLNHSAGQSRSDPGSR
jgi:hypothetical protein